MCVAAALALFAAACGKKGPPLVPYVRVPEAVQSITVKRSGDDVFVSLTVPARNVDTSLPVSISRVDVFGYTGRSAPVRGRWAELATLVATVPIEPAPAPPAAGTSQGPPALLLDAAPPGSTVTVVDKLTAEDLVETPPKPGVAPATPKPRPLKPGELPPPVAPLRRFYAAFGLSEKGIAGPAGQVAEFLLQSVPGPPSALRATHTATEILLAWEPSGGSLGYLLERTELAPEPSPVDDDDALPVAGPAIAAPRAGMAPLGMTTYNVYRVRDPLPGEEQERVAVPSPPGAPPGAPELPRSKWNVPAPVPISRVPPAQFTASDTVEFDRRVCYTVRALRADVESAASEPSCIVPIDTFPPRPPRSVAAVAAANSINLIWEPSDDADVAGYLVLRGVPGDATLQTLTSKPITEARYTDSTVVPGTRYVYAVRAVDGQPTPNVSVDSERAEETAR